MRFSAAATLALCNSLPLTLAAQATAPTAASVAADASARTVSYHSQDIVPIRAKVKYTTLIVVPPTEKIMEAAVGDKDFWIVDVVGNFCFLHPARQGMAEQNTFTQQSLQDEPELRRNAPDPQGVMQKNLKIMLYIGAVVVVLALVLSSVQKAKTTGPSKQTAAQPVVQDNTASNVEALQQQVAADKARDKQDAAMAAAAGNGTPA
jgi:hypothetical protein